MLRGRRFSTLCQDLFCLAQLPIDERGSARGWSWENRIASYLGQHGFPVDPIPGGVRVFGVVPASGLRHQTDAAIDCADAHVIGEWKAYTEPVPKNEVMRFKATTDDLYDAMIDHLPRLPVLRLFGVAGDASSELRWYAARHGISLVERTRWPAPVLADPCLPWPAGDGPGPHDLRCLSWLARPLQQVYPRLPDGSLRLPRRMPDAAVESLLSVQDRWSESLWDYVEARPGVFENHVAQVAA